MFFLIRPRHASLWFLLGVLYLMVAGMRRSADHLLLAALWANFGLWVLAHQEGSDCSCIHEAG
ncbi:MAG: hypothetical protein U0744_00360 [Gemmataceae bacterium]